MTDHVGRQFGNYQLVKLLGQGGFSKVYLGKHRYLNSYAALKILHATINAEDEHKFRAEAQALVDLRHPNIVHLLDFGIEDGTPVLIMDYALKGSLRQYHVRGTQMPLTTVVDFVVQIAAALQYAHCHHVIHRDVKPENVLLDADDRLLLSDFGLSLLISSSQHFSTQHPAGTACYMAPEQQRGKPCFASDQYALAVMVYEWLCGEPPFRGSVWEISHQHLYMTPPSLCTQRPELPVMLGCVVERALAKRPQDRFVSVQAFAEALVQASQTSSASIDECDWSVMAPPQSASLSLPLISPYYAVALPSERKPVTQVTSNAQAKVPPKPSTASTRQRQNRVRLLQKVRSFWITGILEQSLHGTALMALGLQEQPDAVADPWLLIIQELEHTSTPLPAGTRITEVYEQAGGELLILGEPGAGKTTLLLELARDLLDRAEQEQTHPIPVVFNLSSWRRKRQPLVDWLIEELETKYQVPRKVGSDWVKTNQILPLLDGLDEVDAGSRAACMQAINEYHQKQSLIPLVVCCRVNDYKEQANQLALSHAVTIQPLTTEQIDDYFARIGNRIASLRVAFRNDPVLQELATTPLMLTILIVVYQDVSLEEIKGDVSTEIRQQQIFALYTQRMLRRRSATSRYEPQQTVHWLSNLARQMKEQSQTVFYIERMQPDWLMSQWQRRLYYGLVTGPIWGLLVGLEILGTSLPFLLIVLMAALTIGWLFGWLSEPLPDKKSTKGIVRRWMYIRQRLATSLESSVRVGVVAGLVVGIGTMLNQYLTDFSDWSIGSRIAGAFTGGLLNGMYLGVSVGLVIRLERRIEPLEALSWSWKGIPRENARWPLIGTGLVVGLIFVLSLIISSHDKRLANFLSYGLSTGFSIVLVVTLVSGVTRGLSKRVLDAQHIVTPNQGTWRSARYGVVMAGITGVIAAVFTGVIDFIAYFWVPLRMGSSIKPLDMDSSVVSMMSHALGLYPGTTQEFWALHALFWALIGGSIPGPPAAPGRRRSRRTVLWWSGIYETFCVALPALVCSLRAFQLSEVSRLCC